MPERITLEIPVESLDDALAASRGGADRLELCAALELGGLTPTISVFHCISEQVAIPVVAMIRPRSGGCYYTDNDFQVMLRQRDDFIEAGVAGLVFGFLDRDGHIDTKRLEHFVGGVPDTVQTVFHRAFDFVENPAESLDVLISNKITRVLTSGLKPAAVDGIETIKALVLQASGRIEILAGGGVRFENALEIVQATSVNQIHTSCRATAQDRSPRLRPEIQFGLPQLPPETEHRRTDAGLVACMRAALMHDDG